MPCHACGADAEVSWIDVDPSSPGDPLDFVVTDDRFRRASLCVSCLEALDPDMWSCRLHYESLGSQTAFHDLPLCPTEDA